MIHEQPHAFVDQIRRFERFYERHLRKSLRAVVMEDFSLADTRVLHELGLAGGGCSGAWLSDRLDLDAGYLCRILKKLAAYRLVISCESCRDRRMREWEVTSQGKVFAKDIEKEYRARAHLALVELTSNQQRQLVDAMRAIEEVLSGRSPYH